MNGASTIPADDRNETSVTERARPFFYPGNNTGVLCIHGFAGSLDDVKPIAVQLAAHGYTVHGVRLAGHGRDAASLHATGIGDWMDSVRVAAEKLSRQTKSIILLGESMGGLLAMRYARENPSVRAVVLLAPPFSMPHAFRNAIACSILPKRRLIRKPWVTPDQDAEHQQRGSLVSVTAGSYRKLFSLIRSERRMLQKIRVPTLVLIARNDMVTGTEASTVKHRMERSASSSLMTVSVLDGTLHHLGKDKNIGKLVGIIQEFIRSTISSSRNA